MCGFIGLALRDPRLVPTREWLSGMAATLEHRGPDDEGIELRAPFAVAFRRLSIIDLAGGHQPIWNEDRSIAVVCNGEIYNYRELRSELEQRGHRFATHSDVEVIAHLYEELGERFPERLVGMFAAAVFDWRVPSSPRLVLARDRIGIKPLYWALCQQGLLFGSEPKALLASGWLPREMRAEALLEFLMQGYVSGPQAAWNGMQRLLPGTTLSWRPLEAEGRTQPSLRRYWDLPLDELREPAPAAEILEWVDRVVREHLVSDVPLGAFLSGGIDSSSVADAMARARSARADASADASNRSGAAAPLVLCSVGFEEQEFDELERARATAQRLGATHHTRVLRADPTSALEELPWLFDEPLADPSCVPTLLVSKMAREHVTVALSGDGGDEVFGGYRRYVFDVAEQRMRRLLGRSGSRLAGRIGAHYPKLDWAPRFLRASSTLSNLGLDPARAYYQSLTQLPREAALGVLAPELARSLAGTDPFERFAEHYHRPTIQDSLFRAQYADFHSFLPDQILVKGDRASMGASLEVRPPFLDHRFVERFLTLPTREKVRGGRGKHALREALRTRLPSAILDGPKMGFEIPLRRWLAEDLQAVVRESIEDLPKEWFDTARLRQALAEHAAGRRDHSALLWSSFVLARWRRRHGVCDTLK